MRNGGCKRCSHVGVLTPLRQMTRRGLYFRSVERFESHPKIIIPAKKQDGNMEPDRGFEEMKRITLYATTAWLS
jgi:hypothetical protein